MTAPIERNAVSIAAPVSTINAPIGDSFSLEAEGVQRDIVALINEVMLKLAEINKKNRDQNLEAKVKQVMESFRGQMLAYLDKLDSIEKARKAAITEGAGGIVGGGLGVGGAAGHGVGATIEHTVTHEISKTVGESAGQIASNASKVEGALKSAEGQVAGARSEYTQRGTESFRQFCDEMVSRANKCSLDLKETTQALVDAIVKISSSIKIA
ncbi:hypothetical protein FNU76_00110 [Chitinimonas arctica]|uniref:Uncharacterized protein n=1 Tax=Chitinimonas arctica TaxID=2594795 RepID=A0A516S9N7_9NEIS|nr:hypothetical protein [Chitinimonas arctica]QDQ24871.1 hypothetical protein FNU76_00110 [Chitinimonas arctica]